MSKMFRLNVDGTVDVCDDTPDEDLTVVKYQRSAMREWAWVFINWEEHGGWNRVYIHKDTVPKLVKMMDLLDP